MTANPPRILWTYAPNPWSWLPSNNTLDLTHYGVVDLDLSDNFGLDYEWEMEVAYDEGDDGWLGTYDGTARYIERSATSWADTTTWDALTEWGDDGLLYRSGVTIVAPGTWADMTQPWAGFGEPWLYGAAATTFNYADPWVDMTDTWDTYTGAWVSVASATSGTYTSEIIDIGYAVQAVVTVTPEVGVLQRELTPWTAFTDTWSAYRAPTWVWQGRADAISATYLVSTRKAGETWGPWTLLTAGALEFQFLRVRVVMSTDDTTIRPLLTTLDVTTDVPDRVEHLEDVAVPSAGKTITFAPAFVGIKTVQVTLQSALPGDRFTVTGKSNTAVTINVFDSAGTAKAGLVDVDVFGHGERS